MTPTRNMLSYRRWKLTWLATSLLFVLNNRWTAPPLHKAKPLILATHKDSLSSSLYNKMSTSTQTLQKMAYPICELFDSGSDDAQQLLQYEIEQAPRRLETTHPKDDEDVCYMYYHVVMMWIILDHQVINR